MLLRPVGGGWVVTDVDTLTKEQFRTGGTFSKTPVRTTTFVAQRGLDNSTGYILEDASGICHEITNSTYLSYGIDQLNLPEITLSTMTVGEALVIIDQFAKEYVDGNYGVMLAYPTPNSFILAKSVIGNGDSSKGQEVFLKLIAAYELYKV
jgi:hypothetical protein